jgi:putative endonuclease
MVKRWEAGDSPGKAGFQAESLALQHLLKAGLRLVQRNYRVARGPGARAGEIDLIMREPDGTIVFVEVRARAAPVSAGAFGGAAASVGSLKQRRIVFAAKHWLMRQAALPPCRFDVVSLDGEHLQWLKAAFDAG